MWRNHGFESIAELLEKIPGEKCEKHNSQPKFYRAAKTAGTKARRKVCQPKSSRFGISIILFRSLLFVKFFLVRAGWFFPVIQGMLVFVFYKNTRARWGLSFASRKREGGERKRETPKRAGSHQLVVLFHSSFVA